MTDSGVYKTALEAVPVVVLSLPVVGKPRAAPDIWPLGCCPALKMTMTPSLSMKTKMVALVATLTG